MTLAKLSPALCAGLFLSLASTASFADERCEQLVKLNRQYAGVALTDQQKSMKVQMVAWYKENCARGTRSASRN